MNGVTIGQKMNQLKFLFTQWRELDEFSARLKFSPLKFHIYIAEETGIAKTSAQTTTKLFRLKTMDSINWCTHNVWGHFAGFLFLPTPTKKLLYCSRNDSGWKYMLPILLNFQGLVTDVTAFLEFLEKILSATDNSLQYHFDASRWDHCVVSKCQEVITQWHCIIPQKNRNFLICCYKQKSWIWHIS